MDSSWNHAGSSVRRMSSRCRSGSRSRKAAAASRTSRSSRSATCIGGVHRGQPVVQVAPPAVQAQPEQFPLVLRLAGQHVRRPQRGRVGGAIGMARLCISAGRGALHSRRVGSAASGAATQGRSRRNPATRCEVQVQQVTSSAPEASDEQQCHAAADDLRHRRHDATDDHRKDTRWPTGCADPTMNDVARASGVSLKSVSRVINDEVGASPETREKVLAAAAKLGYRRNDAAHALRRVGRPIRVDRAGARGHQQPVRRGAEPLRRTGRRGAGQPGAGGQHQRRPGPRGIPGAPAAGQGRRRVGDHVLPSRPRLPAAGDSIAGCRSIFVDRPPRRLACPTVRVANSKGAHDATAHLIAHGHHRIAFLGDRPRCTPRTNGSAGTPGRCTRPDSPPTPICSGVVRPIRVQARRRDGGRCSSWPTRRRRCSPATT